MVNSWLLPFSLLVIVIILCVRNRRTCTCGAYGKTCVLPHVDDALRARELIERVKSHNRTLVKMKGGDYPLLARNYNENAIFEVHPNNTFKFTSYVADKGSAFGLCARQTDLSLVDMNTLMYVDVHELAHLASEETGHGIEFKEKFHDLLSTAVALGMYTPIDYQKNKVQYCGIEIDRSILFPDEPKAQ